MNLTFTTQYLVELLLCSTVLLLLALMLTKFVRGWSAAVRHRVWLLSFFALVILPFALLVLPSMNLPVLPPVAQENLADAPENESTSPATITQRHQEVPRTTGAPIENRSTNQLEAKTEDRSQLAKPIHSENQALTSLPTIHSSVASSKTTANNSNRFGGWWLLVIWAIGFLAIFASLGTAIIRNRRLVQNAQVIETQSWQNLMSELCGKLDIRDSVSLLSPPHSVMPMTIGVFQPVIVLPKESKNWSPACRRAVLTHELAHIKRNDVLAQTFARLVSGVYWFNPLAWIALRQLRVERELACDDCVVTSGQKPSEYARELVQIARSYRLPANLVGAAMASSAKLEYRVQSLLDLARSHVPVSKNAARKLILCVLVVTLGLSTIRLGRQVVSGSTTPTNENNNVLDPNDGIERFRGIVVDADGNPVDGAIVAFVHTKVKSLGYHFDSNELVTSVVSNQAGRFELIVRERLIQTVSKRRPGAVGRSGEHSYEEQLSIVATKPGLGADWQTVFDLVRGLPSEDIKLTLVKEVPIKGRLLDQEGNPLSNVSVRPYSIYKPFPGIDWKKWSANTSTEGFPISDVCCTQLNPFVDKAFLTDRNGEFQLNGFAPDQLVTIEILGDGVAKNRVTILTRPLDEPLPSPRVDRRYLVKLYFGAEFEMVVPPEQIIHGTVRDKDTGLPIPGVKVESQQSFVESITDKDGRYELRGLPRPATDDQNVRISLSPSRDTPYLGATYVEVPRGENLEPVEFNMVFKKGLWLEGRLVDHETGRPEFGYVGFSPNLDNEVAKSYERYTPGRFSMLPDLVPTDADGKFRIPVVPGQGIAVAIAAESAKFEIGFGEKPGEDLPRGLNPSTFKYYALLGVDTVNSVMTLEIPKDAQPKAISFPLRRLPVKTLKFRDLENNSLEKVRTLGIFGPGLTSPQQRLESNAASSGDEVDVFGLEPDSGRMMFFHQSERDLGLARIIQVDDPAEIELMPCGKIRGKVDGVVRRSAYPTYVVAFVPGSNLPGSAAPELKFDMMVAKSEVKADGSFELEGIVPGVALKLRIEGSTFDVKENNAAIEPGDVIDVGTLDLKSAEPDSSEGKMSTKSNRGSP